MESISGLPVNTLTDREILLLTYQQLQTVSEEFKLYKASNDGVLADLQKRMVHIEQHILSEEAVKKSQEAKFRKQVVLVSIIVTAINLLVSLAAKLIHT